MFPTFNPWYHQGSKKPIMNPSITDDGTVTPFKDYVIKEEVKHEHEASNEVSEELNSKKGSEEIKRTIGYGYANKEYCKKSYQEFIEGHERIKEKIKILESLGDSTNPKDLIGQTKPSLTKIPFSFLAHVSQAMSNGASKYGAYNWRTKKVQADIYIDAALRHLGAWYDGEEVAEDSGVHHLAHAAACMAILIDALETGNLVDNRPMKGKFADIVARMTKANDNVQG